MSYGLFALSLGVIGRLCWFVCSINISWCHLVCLLYFLVSFSLFAQNLGIVWFVCSTPWCHLVCLLYLLMSLVGYVSLFALPLVVIGRLCSVMVTVPGRLLYYL